MTGAPDPDDRRGAGGAVGAEPAPPTAEDDLLPRVAALIDGLELRDVRTVKWAGELHRHQADTGEASAEPHVPRFRVTEDQVSVWFDYTVHVADADGEIATIEVGTVLDFDRLGQDRRPLDEDAVSCFADTNAFFIAFPYIRESVHTVARRLGLGGVVLGMVRRQVAPPTDGDVRGAHR